MILLLSKAHGTIVRYAHPNLGRLVTPRHWNRVADTATVMPWAADNDAYLAWDQPRFEAMLGDLAGVPGCLFVAAPDVVADAPATLARFDLWEPRIRDAGQPVALVAQDGLEHLEVPWDRLDALFLGGTTEWKLSDAATLLASRARELGKWVHMGRVNSVRRINHARAIGCDSFDGTQWSMFTDRYLPDALDVLAGPWPQHLPIA